MSLIQGRSNTYSSKYTTTKKINIYSVPETYHVLSPAPHHSASSVPATFSHSPP